MKSHQCPPQMGCAHHLYHEDERAEALAGLRPSNTTNIEATTFNFAAVDESLSFSEPGELVPYMTPRDVVAYQVKRTALMALLNMETRSFSEIAESLGVTTAAISKEYCRLISAFGWESLFRKLETRKRNAAAARRRHDGTKHKVAA